MGGEQLTVESKTMARKVESPRNLGMNAFEHVMFKLFYAWYTLVNKIADILQSAQSKVFRNKIKSTYYIYL